MVESGPVSHAGFARGGERLLTLGRFGDRSALVAWDTRAWSRVWASEAEPDARWLASLDEAAVITRDATHVRVWSMATGAFVVGFATDLDVRAPLPGGRVAALRDVPLHLPDGTTRDEGTRVVVLDAGAGVIESHFALHAKVTGFVVDAEARRALAIDADGLSVWDLGERRKRARLEGSGAAALFRPRSDEVVLAGSFADGHVPVVFDASSGARLGACRPPTATVAPCAAAAIGADGRWLVTSHGDQPDNHWFRDQLLCVWDLDARRCVRAVRLDGQGWPQAIAVAKDHVVAVATGSALAVWELELP